MDGLDAGVNIVNILRDWEMDVIILGGATFAGFNVVDVDYVYREIGKPIIVYMSKYPDMDATLSADNLFFSCPSSNSLKFRMKPVANIKPSSVGGAWCWRNDF